MCFTRFRLLIRGAKLALVALGFASTASMGQTVNGRVTDESTGEPVAGARVSLRDMAGGEVSGAITNDLGLFELQGPASGEYGISVHHLAFAEYESTGLDLSEGELLEIEIRLGLEAIPLDPLVVLARRRPGGGRIADFEARRDSPSRTGGYFVSEEDIERRIMTTPSNLVLEAPGAMVAPVGGAFGMDRNVITLPGQMGNRCLARVFVDGLQVRQGGQQTVDDYLDTQNIGGVEVYPRHLTAPVQYQSALPPKCGVVLFWTREGEVSSRGWGKKRIAIGTGLIAALLWLGFSSQGSPPG